MTGSQQNSPLYVALDVCYLDDRALTGAVLFDDWSSEHPNNTFTSEVSPVAPYLPGQFYLRELPCLVAALELLNRPPNAVVIDGFVWLDKGQPGLGARLWEALEESVPVIGVAKSAWHSQSDATPVRGQSAIALKRGKSERPLWVTSQGIDPEQAAANIASMHGPHRLPTLLKLADSIGREAAR